LQFATFAAATLLALLLLRQTTHAQMHAPDTVKPNQISGIQVFSVPDESTPPIAVLAFGETTTPVAESQGPGGEKWYLIKTKNGVVGWIKHGSEEAKKLDGFFKSLPAEPSVSSQIPLTSSASVPRGAIIVPVLLAGRSAIVPVLLNQSIRGNLLLDTGASNTVLSRQIAASLSLRTMGSRRFQTAGGAISVSMAHLQSLKVGDAEVNDLTVAVHDFSPDPRFEGLLGMDFLGRYLVALDAQKQVLVLSPR